MKKLITLRVVCGLVGSLICYIIIHSGSLGKDLIPWLFGTAVGLALVITVEFTVRMIKQSRTKEETNMKTTGTKQVWRAQPLWCRIAIIVLSILLVLSAVVVVYQYVNADYEVEVTVERVVYGGTYKNPVLTVALRGNGKYEVMEVKGSIVYTIPFLEGDKLLLKYDKNGQCKGLYDKTSGKAIISE